MQENKNKNDALAEKPTIIYKEKTVFERFGLFLFLGGLFLWYMTYFTQNILFGYWAILGAWGIFEFWKMRKENAESDSIKYRPFELKEIREIEEQILRELGKNVELDVDKFRGEPELGQGSAEPYVMRFQGKEILPNGVMHPIQVGISLRTPKRTIIHFERERRTYDSSVRFFTGNLKPKDPTPEPTIHERLFVPRATRLEVDSGTDDEKKEEEENDN